jgi:hypothetical protein
MSNSGGKNNRSYTPADPPPPPPARLTVDEIRGFKQALEDSKLAWAIYAAGLAAILDILHIIWLGFRFALKF